jgi:arginyl-tRNA synthetase
MKIINEIIDKAVAELQLPICAYSVTHPKEEAHGDYSVNIAMILWKQISNQKFSNSQIKSPRDLAQNIVDHINKGPSFVFEKVEVAGAGFINFYLTKEYLLKELTNATNPSFGKNENLNKQKTYVEFTDPNPFKEFHIGHLMSNTIGEALCRIFEANGAIIKRANYQGDVGLHVAKSIWGLEQKLKKDGKQLSDLQVLTLKERIAYLGAAYAYGAGLYETDPTSPEGFAGAREEMNEMNGQIYNRTNEQINELYDQGRAWSLEYFETIYARLGTKFDEYFFESEAGPAGLKVIEEALSKEVLELGDEGAVVFKGEKYGLHTRVFRNKLGLPTYEGKELGLPQMKYGRWAYDKSFIVTANEIDEYFKVLLKVLSLISPELGGKTTHLSHGMMKLTTGKMSSRTGKVVTGEGLLDELKETVLEKMGVREIKNKEVIADQVAVGALKYTVLRQALGGDIVYEPEKMTNLEGNTGPFIQYTHARAKSILNKFTLGVGPLKSEMLNPQEMSVLRWLYRYPEVVADAGSSFAPHLIATYIYELASRFNSFYQACRVFEEDPTSPEGSAGARNGEVNALRYELTRATANVLKSGLGLLGITAPEEM